VRAQIDVQHCPNRGWYPVRQPAQTNPFRLWIPNFFDTLNDHKNPQNSEQPEFMRLRS
jgi:hypothetical protein